MQLLLTLQIFFMNLTCLLHNCLEENKTNVCLFSRNVKLISSCSHPPSTLSRPGWLMSSLYSQVKLNHGASHSGRGTPGAVIVFLPSAAREAACKLFSVEQGHERVTEYIIEFHANAADSRWNKEALTDEYFSRFKRWNKRCTGNPRLPGVSPEVGRLATCMDLSLWERDRERVKRPVRTPRLWV